LIFGIAALDTRKRWRFSKKRQTQIIHQVVIPAQAGIQQEKHPANNQRLG
jgi:hypothetical protein